MAALLSYGRSALKPSLSQPIERLVGARHSYTSLRGFFYGWSDIDGDLLPLPHPTNDLNSDKLRVSPPNAAWYTVTRKPVFTEKTPQPLDWNDADCKKNLADHKKILMDACYTGGIRDEWQRKVIMAIAMLETEYMWGRDWKKDYKWESKNAWCLNLNMDMLERVGYNQHPSNGFSDLTQHQKLPEIIGYLKIWLDGKATVNVIPQRTPHVRSTLNYIRMGSTGYNNDDPSLYNKGVDQKCRDYRSAIFTTVNAINGSIKPPPGQHELWGKSNQTAILNDERIGIDVPWC